MDARIRVTGWADEDLPALGELRGGEDELRRRARAVRSPIDESEPGSITELLVPALGSGGAGTVLTSSRKTWLATRRTTAKITVESAGRPVAVDAETVGEA